MNPLILFLAFFCVLGLVDKIFGRWSLGQYVDRGVTAAAASFIPYVGICSVGPLLIDLLYGAPDGKSLAAPIAFGCLLAPDLGGLKLSLAMAPSLDWALFCGLVLSGCVGQFISFQLSVVTAVIPEPKGELIEGFVAGIVSAPFGILVGGLVFGLPMGQVAYSCLPIFAVCIVIAAGFLVRPGLTQKILRFVSWAVQALCTLMFAATVVLLFSKPDIITEPLTSSMVAFVRMTAVIIGGTVFSGCARKYLNIERLEKAFGINDASLTGLILNSINSLAMAPLWTRMDPRGKRLNGAFTVSGSYLIGGQLAFATGTGHPMALFAFLASKFTAGVLGMIVVILHEKVSAKSGHGGT